jgi:Holliday junction resolvase RusA-like endonuclease
VITKAGRLAVIHPAKLGEYRGRISAALALAHPDGPPRHPGPCSVGITYWIDRPAGHYRTGRNAHLLREGAPPRPTGHTTGDADKIARAALDAVTDSCVWHDDSQVVELYVSKLWTPSVPAVPAGLHLVIRALA